jgi:hypothetical protein
MNCTRLSVVACLMTLLLVTPAWSIDFAHEIVPILKKHCVTCHGGREEEGGFSINTRESVIDSGMVDLGDADASYLVELITSSDPAVQMPPPDRVRVPQEDVQLIRRWIEDDLKWEDGFTFALDVFEPPLRPREVDLPPAVNGRDHPIDRLLDDYCRKQGVPIPEPADETTFLRRAYLDLIGLLPTPGEVDAFLADSDPERREALIEELLDRRVDYADHWLTFFNDLLRNDYSGTGFITGGRKQISTWLYACLLENKPFDQMTRELVAPPTAASQGFIDGIKWRGNVSAGQTIEIQFAQNVSQAFLGINMKCASCHDSFIDRWTLNEAYGLAAIYASEPLAIYRCDKPTGETQSASWLFPELGQIDPEAPREEQLRQLAELMTHPENGRYARTIVNRLWHRMMGRGLVHPLDAMQTEPWYPELLDYLANHFVDSGYDLKSVLHLIATSQAYQSRCEVSEEKEGNADYVYRGPLQRRMTAEQFIDAVWQLTGTAPQEFDAPVFRSNVTPEMIAAVELRGDWIWGPTETMPVGGDQWLMRKSFTLPAEITGGGAVITCDNEFAVFVGGREIASGSDWTRPQLVDFGNTLKAGENTIVIRVANAGNAGSPNPAGLYFQAHWELEDGTTFSLSSDTTWQANSNVPSAREGRMGTPGKGWQSAVKVDAVSSWQQTLRERARPLIAQAISSADAPSMVRAALIKNTPLMQSLGRPIRDQIVSMRPDGLTTLEAIDLANSPEFSNALKDGSERWAESYAGSRKELVEQLFRAVLTRRPTDAEWGVIDEALGDSPSDQQIQDLMWALLMQPEFMMIR